MEKGKNFCYDGCMEKEQKMEHKSMNSEELPVYGEIRVDNHGRKWQWRESGYTIRQYFAHETSEKGPGPGWDFRQGLLDEEYAMRRFGRTFSIEEVFGQKPLPDDPYYDWERYFDDDAK